MHYPTARPAHHAHTLRVRRLGIDTYQEPVIYMRRDCPVCRSEGLDAHSRVAISFRDRVVIATLNVVYSELLSPEEAGLSEAAWHALDAVDGAHIALAHAPPVDSFSYVRAKIYGERLDGPRSAAIMRDIVRGHYSDLQLAAFVTACAGGRLDTDETIELTRAMLDSGQRLQWNRPIVVDKHCVGGLPGNRTTPIVVAIVAACGLTIPKTSSRAITSPAGTADTMEVLAPVRLPVQQIRHVVEREGGCLAWGGAISLSPADDILIGVERPLDFDSDAQMVASILSKKLAAGSTHVLVDIPVGDSAKVRSAQAAAELAALLRSVGQALGIEVACIVSDGSQPVGRGIGPALEAMDVLAVLRREADAPADLRERALQLAGQLLEMGGKALPGEGCALARLTLDSGKAWNKFQAICLAQGGMRTPPRAPFRHMLLAPRAGRVAKVDNRRLAKLAKLAGAPAAPTAGLLFEAPIGRVVAAGDTLMTIHAASQGELQYARAYAEQQHDMVTLENL